MTMEDKSIQQVALYDPVKAYGMALGIPLISFEGNVKASFTSFTVPQPIVEGDLDVTVASRWWIDNIAYTLRAPNQFAGNVFKAQSDAALQRNTGVNARITVLGGPKYVNAPSFTPIENMFNQWASRWPHGWPIFKMQSIHMDFMLVAPPSAQNPNGPPLDMTITFNGSQFFDTSIDNVSTRDAVAGLRKMGYCVPDPSCIRTY